MSCLNNYYGVVQPLGQWLMVREAEHAQSKADFISKMSMGLKEINESIYWINLLYDTDYIEIDDYGSHNVDADEVLKNLFQ